MSNDMYEGNRIASFLGKLKSFVFSRRRKDNSEIFKILGIKIKLNKSNKARERQEAEIEMYSKLLLVNSKLFDEKYYLYNYSEVNREVNITPLEHYLRKGWLLGYNPSAEFDAVRYQKEYPFVKENPLVHFLRFGRRRCIYGYFENKHKPDEAAVIEYLGNKPKRKSKKVIYTCIVGRYDTLLQHKYINNDWDYICYSDDEALINKGYEGIWEIRPLVLKDLDGTRVNRYHKICAHKILSEYDESIYIDANINILTPYLFDEVINKRNLDLILPKHISQECLYNEINWALNDAIDDASLIKRQLSLLEEEGFPKNYGMSENNIIYRKHNDEKLVKLMEDWWYMVKNYCKRDQTSFAYVMWKNNIKMENHLFQNARMDLDNFAFVKHCGRKS